METTTATTANDHRQNDIIIVAVHQDHHHHAKQQHRSDHRRTERSFSHRNHRHRSSSLPLTIHQIHGRSRKTPGKSLRKSGMDGQLNNHCYCPPPSSRQQCDCKCQSLRRRSQGGRWSFGPSTKGRSVWTRMVLGLGLISMMSFSGGGFNLVQCDIFSSTAHIQNLMHLERHLVGSLTDYLVSVEEKVFQVKTYLSEFAYTAGQTRYAGTYADNIMDNPLQAYQLLKRLTVNWKKIQAVMHSPQGTGDWDAVENLLESYKELMPNLDDLNGAALALVRLQDTYNLNLTDMAGGRLMDKNAMVEMSARDCLYLGKNAFSNGYYGHSLEWFEEALNRAHREGNQTADVDEIMPFYEMAVEYHNKVDDELKQANYTRYSDKLRLLEGDGEDFQAYQKLCRGEQIETDHDYQRPPVAPRCYLTTNGGQPGLILAPARVEVFHHRPFVAMFHGVLSDDEIDVYKQLATPILTRARVQTEEQDEQISQVRVSQTAWFHEHHHPLLQRVNERIQALTGLSLSMNQSHCELVQIANYGMGGHYVPHYDYLIKDKPEEQRWNVSEKELFAGDRMATFMIYLSDVVSGGSTVFTRLGVHVKPVKGSAIFWYNLSRNGEGIMDTVHGACPVLMGEKWVANYWIREHGQFLKRKCSLDPEE